MKKIKSRIEKTIILTTISSSAGLPAAYLRKGFNLPTERPPLASLQVGWMTEITCSQELSSLSMKNSSLNLLSS
ncbi:hypothetical protein AYI68_g623 [Smittium mucronatum]|uniref:Uncharacterized protein n=1 Tax=Smittium mucronatum TaxID=133383 RepID=A0A1R0H7K1_9FUNG|nr:hypothetical protein AYI68_g623 [Smittium mucronatum]